MSRMTEAEIEGAALAWLGELGWTHVYGPQIEPEKPDSERETLSTVFLAGRLRSALRRLNPGLPDRVLGDAFTQITRPESPDLLTNNRSFHLALTGTVNVPYRNADGEETTAIVFLVDWDKPENNDFLAVNQFTVWERKYLEGDSTPAKEHDRRPDIVMFLNGLPLVVIELKNAGRPEASVEAAFKQIQTYKSQITGLFTYNELCVISDGTDARMGTISSDQERFMPWRAIEEPVEGRGDLKTLLFGVFEKRRFLDLIRYFIVFEDVRTGVIKKVAGYHQFHAVNTALKASIEASREGSNGRAGVVWHTQGSGKSLTMAYFTGRAILAKELENPTIVVVTDRNDLDEQLFNTFAACKDLLRQTPLRTESRAKIRELLNRNAGGVIFTTIQKFFPDPEEERYPELTARRNIIVLADEAHRSQYGLEAQMVLSGEKAGTLVEGYAMHMRRALPNASFLAFTGTPIDLKSASTTRVFGDIISVYDVQRAVEDKATVPIFYEGRFAKLSIDEEQRPKIDAEFEEITEGEEEIARAKLISEWTATEALVGDEKRLQQVAEDLVKHWEKRLEGMPGKAMIVCMSRRIAVAMYERLIALRPEWDSDHDGQGVVKVVMTGSASDDPSWQKHIRPKRVMESLANRYKDPDDPFKLVIVCDMWLTGFDAPCMHTMYIDKPMHGHNLMQAIARVNRVFGPKPGGLVVDYLGLGESLKKALAEYTAVTGKDEEDTAANQKKAVDIFMGKLYTCRGMMQGVSYVDWASSTPQDRLDILGDAAEFLFSQDDDTQRDFARTVYELSQAYALAVPDEKVLQHEFELSFFQAVRAVYIKETTIAKPGQKNAAFERELAVRQLVSRSILPGGVVDLFQAAGLEKPNIALISDEFLGELKNQPRRNLALELLKRLLLEEIQRQSEKNVAKSQKFGERLEDAIKKYTNQAITMTQMIDMLVAMAKDARDDKGKGDRLGLSEEETAFYDALITSKSAVEIMGDEKLAFIARELLKTVRQSATIDWHVRESAKANMRRLVKRLLRRYGYPPELEEAAVKSVIEQAETTCRDV